jgi:hypothetical protein
MRRILAVGAVLGGALLLQTTTALACGGLVAPDGDVRLDKATTFVTWHAGVEHYVTSFAFDGAVTDLGWIVPLPALPTSIEPAGKWTLQRLEREVNPVRFDAFAALAPTAGSAASIIVEQVQVEALNVTVLKGSGRAVVDWCIHNGFLLPPETKDHLLVYAKESPVFMAAKYDVNAARLRGQHAGEGVPLLITMNTPRLWVPLEVLANDDTRVNADVFLLTDRPLSTVDAPFSLAGFFGSQDLSGAPGFRVARQEPMNDVLFSDLSSDRNMGWVPRDSYLTYLTLNAPSEQVTYDLAVGSDSVIRLAAFGTSPASTVNPHPDGFPAAWLWAVAGGGALLTATAALTVLRRLRRRVELS